MKVTYGYQIVSYFRFQDKNKDFKSIFYSYRYICSQYFFSIISFGWIVYMLFIKLFGESSKSGWVVNGVVVLFQLALFVGAAGSIILIAKKKVIRLAGSII